MTKPSEAHTTPSLTSTRLAIPLTAVAVGLYWMALYLYVPTLPVYAQTKTPRLELVGVVLAQYGLWQAIVRLPLGIASDRSGRRTPWIHLGFLLAGAGAVLMGNAGGYAGLAAGRAVTGLAAGSWVVMVVAFSSLFPPRQAVRATVLLTLINSISRMLATGLNGVLNDLGGYELAFYLAGGCALAAVLVYLPVHEAPRPAQRPSLKSTGALVTRRDVLLPAVLNAAIQYIAYATTFGFVPILARQLGASQVALGVLVSLNIGVITLGNLFTNALLHRTTARNLVYTGFIFSALGITLAGWAGSLAMVYASQLIIGLGNGICYPILMGLSIEQVEEGERSTAMGLHQAVYAVGMFAGPWLSGILADSIGIQPMFTLTAALTLALGMGLSSLLKK